MAVFKSTPALPGPQGPQGKTVLGIAAGSSAVLYLVMLALRKNRESKESTARAKADSMHQRQDYTSTDAFSTTVRDAKNINAKGSLPNAHGKFY